MYNLICIGRAGLGSITSNYGTPSKPGVRRPPINLGVFHCDVITTREIIVTNNGTLDIRILNVTACINDVAVQKKKKKKNDGSSVDSASSSSLEYNWCLPTNIRDIETGIDLVENNIVQFGTEYTKYQSPQDASSRDSNNNSNKNKNKNKKKNNTKIEHVEIDWEEVDYILSSEQIIKQQESTNKEVQQFQNQRITNQTEDDKEKEEDAADEEEEKEENFPVILRPGQQFPILLKFQTKINDYLLSTNWKEVYKDWQLKVILVQK